MTDTIIVDRARREIARVHGNHRSLWSEQLLGIVAAPARQIAIDLDAAGMVVAGRDRQVLTPR